MNVRFKSVVIVVGISFTLWFVVPMFLAHNFLLTFLIRFFTLGFFACGLFSSLNQNSSQRYASSGRSTNRQSVSYTPDLNVKDSVAVNAANEKASKELYREWSQQGEESQKRHNAEIARHHEGYEQERLAKEKRWREDDEREKRYQVQQREAEERRRQEQAMQENYRRQQEEADRRRVDDERNREY